jgi:hypothetical protein
MSRGAVVLLLLESITYDRAGCRGVLRVSGPPFFGGSVSIKAEREAG